jgi:hypothetical protein
MSYATKELNDLELESILEKSKVNNYKYNVTGILIVKGALFLQCLEGKKEDVLSIYNKILGDTRHDNIIDLYEENLGNRLFPDWSMGYKNLKNLEVITSEKLRDFSEINDKEFSQDNISEIIKEFVTSN